MLKGTSTNDCPFVRQAVALQILMNVLDTEKILLGLRAKELP